MNLFEIFEQYYGSAYETVSAMEISVPCTSPGMFIGCTVLIILCANVNGCTHQWKKIGRFSYEFCVNLAIMLLYIFTNFYYISMILLSAIVCSTL